MSDEFQLAYERIFADIMKVNPHMSDIHGLSHWKAVEANGIHLAIKNGANPKVVRLFAIFHDACRRDDGGDPEHGLRAARMVLRMRHQLPLTDDEMVLLIGACAWHADGLVNKRDITIGTCWDADRLDLIRPGVNIVPEEKMLSTEAARIVLRQTLAKKKGSNLSIAPL